MSAQESENRKGSRKGILWFFIFAIACIVAFLIVGLVKTCTADHEEKALEEEIQQEQVGMNQSSENGLHLLS